MTKPSTVPAPPAQDLCGSVGCVTGMSGCCLGEQGASDTIENSQGFCMQVSEKCDGSGLC